MKIIYRRKLNELHWMNIDIFEKDVAKKLEEIYQKLKREEKLKRILKND